MTEEQRKTVQEHGKMAEEQSKIIKEHCFVIFPPC